MITKRPSSERGHFDHGWLDTYHTFSFGEYNDPAHMGFRSLRVINDDRVKPGMGFGMHPHRDMEIITYVLDGQLQHKDSMGNGSVIRPGEVQYMSAGRGVTHSEFNPSKEDPLHLLQIWLLPEVSGATPRYDQKDFSDRLRPGELALLASPDGADDSIAIRQDARLFGGLLELDREIRHAIAPGRSLWLHVARGTLSVHGNVLNAGDAAAIRGEPAVHANAGASAEFLLFDLG